VNLLPLSITTFATTYAVVAADLCALTAKTNVRLAKIAILGVYYKEGHYASLAHMSVASPLAYFVKQVHVGSAPHHAVHVVLQRVCLGRVRWHRGSLCAKSAISVAASAPGQSHEPGPSSAQVVTNFDAKNV